MNLFVECFMLNSKRGVIDNMKKTNLLNYPHVLTVGSAVGLIASFWQATERIHMLKYPSDPLSCNLSPVVDCSGVLNNKAAALFGPPNAFIGIVAFSLLLAFGLQRLSGGKWTTVVSRIVLVLSIVMLLFSLWFFAESVYVIGKICIFCVFIWTVSVPIGIYGIKDFFDNEAYMPGLMRTIFGFVSRNYFSFIVYSYAVMIALFFVHFRDYYF